MLLTVSKLFTLNQPNTSKETPTGTSDPKITCSSTLGEKKKRIFNQISEHMSRTGRFFEILKH